MDHWDFFWNKGHRCKPCPGLNDPTFPLSLASADHWNYPEHSRLEQLSRFTPLSIIAIFKPHVRSVHRNSGCKGKGDDSEKGGRGGWIRFGSPAFQKFTVPRFDEFPCPRHQSSPELIAGQNCIPVSSLKQIPMVLSDCAVELVTGKEDQKFGSLVKQIFCTCCQVARTFRCTRKVTALPHFHLICALRLVEAA